jgi:hypothetical protein
MEECLIDHRWIGAGPGAASTSAARGKVSSERSLDDFSTLPVRSIESVTGGVRRALRFG